MFSQFKLVVEAAEEFHPFGPAQRTRFQIVVNYDNRNANSFKFLKTRNRLVVNSVCKNHIGFQRDNALHVELFVVTDFLNLAIANHLHNYGVAHIFRTAQPRYRRSLAQLRNESRVCCREADCTANWDLYCRIGLLAREMQNAVIAR